jgi:hypothetical protein
MQEIDFSKIPQRICNVIFPEAKYNQEEANKLFTGFQEKFVYLTKYKGLKKLLDMFTAENICSHLEDHFIEINLAYDIVRHNSDIDIEYEQEIKNEGNKRTPDFKFHIDKHLYYIQAKRVSEPKSFNEQSKAFPGEFVPVDNLPQTSGALIKATKFVPDEPCIYLIVQYNNERYFDLIGIGEALYGKEAYEITMFSDESAKTRIIRTPSNNIETNGGFFYTDEGKCVNAFISAKSESLFGKQCYTVFENSEKQTPIGLISKIIDVDKVINRNTYIED